MSCVEHSQYGASAKYGTARHAGTTVMAHRLAYAKANGLDVFTMGGTVLHSCDNPRCITPEHMTLSTQQANMDDKVAKGRQAKGNSHGMSVLTEEQVSTIKSIYRFRCKEFGGKALALLYGVSDSTISDIMRGRSHAGVI